MLHSKSRNIYLITYYIYSYIHKINLAFVYMYIVLLSLRCTMLDKRNKKRKKTTLLITTATTLVVLASSLSSTVSLDRTIRLFSVMVFVSYVRYQGPGAHKIRCAMLLYSFTKCYCLLTVLNFTLTPGNKSRTNNTPCAKYITQILTYQPFV